MVWALAVLIVDSQPNLSQLLVADAPQVQNYFRDEHAVRFAVDETDSAETRGLRIAMDFFARRWNGKSLPLVL